MRHFFLSKIMMFMPTTKKNFANGVEKKDIFMYAVLRFKDVECSRISQVSHIFINIPISILMAETDHLLCSMQFFLSSLSLYFYDVIFSEISVVRVYISMVIIYSIY